MHATPNRPAVRWTLTVALLAASPLGVGVVPGGHADAANPQISNHDQGRASTSAASDYWTPERMRNARELPMPEAPSGSEVMVEGRGMAEQAESRGGGPGAPPSVTLEIPGAASQYGEWDADVESDDGEGDPAGSSSVDEPTSVGTSGCHFSSSRLIPRTSDTRYPYAAVGKLFFTQPGVGDFVCSGAVLRPRLVLTAGHCVHSGNGQQSGFFENFRFCPAYRGKPGKHGCWDWAYVTTTNTWFTSGNVFPNAADYAIFEMQDRTIQGVSRKIGDLTGYFGYSTLALSANHIHMLGYPVGFSNGQRMHQVAAARCTSGGNNTERYGSDMRGGSSGGPWVQDFGVPAAGQTVSSPFGPNLIVGINSYANVSTDPKYVGSSIPDSRFESVLNDACANRAGNC